LYRRIATVREKEDCDDIYDELSDRYGDVPRQIENLLAIALIRSRAETCGMTRVTQKGGEVSVYSPSGDLRVTQAFEGSFRDACPFGKKVLVLTDEYIYDINNGGIARQVEAESDSRMVGSINGKAALLRLTELDTVDFNPKPTETTAVVMRGVSAIMQ